MTSRVESETRRLTAEYRQRTPGSAALAASKEAGCIGAAQHAFGSVALPYPLAAKGGNGAYLYDVDGNRYLDLVVGWNSSYLGRGNPQITEAVTQGVERVRRADRGELRRADECRARRPPVRTASGRRAHPVRPVGQRSEFFRCSPCPPVHRPRQDSQVPLLVSRHVRRSHDRQLEHERPAFEHRRKHRSQQVQRQAGDRGTAGPESRPARSGHCRTDQRPGEHQAARLVSAVPSRRDDGAGDRIDLRRSRDWIPLRRRGAAAHYGIDPAPDLITLGKMLGGGLPVCAVVGRQEVMDGPINASSTHMQNPVCHAAALAFLDQLSDDLYRDTNALGDALRDGLREAIAAAGSAGSGHGRLHQCRAAPGTDASHRAGRFHLRPPRRVPAHQAGAHGQGL